MRMLVLYRIDEVPFKKYQVQTNRSGLSGHDPHFKLIHGPIYNA